MTIDPVSTGNREWKTFLGADNQFWLDRGGKPPLNQTFRVTVDIAQKAFGGRLKTLEQTRKTYDPGHRLLNPYFQSILSSGEAATPHKSDSCYPNG